MNSLLFFGTNKLLVHSQPFATYRTYIITTWLIRNTLTAFYLLSKHMPLLFGTISRESELKIRLLSSRMLRAIQMNNVLHLQVHDFDEGTVTSVCGTQLPAPSQQVEQYLPWFNSEIKAAFEQNNSQTHPKSPCTPSCSWKNLWLLHLWNDVYLKGKCRRGWCFPKQYTSWDRRLIVRWWICKPISCLQVRIWPIRYTH